MNFGERCGSLGLNFHPSRPWNAVWVKTADDVAFWREEVDELCMLILTKITTAGDVLEDDAKVDKPLPASSSARETTLGPARVTQEKQFRPRNRNRTGRVHSIDNGKYTVCGNNECIQSSQGAWCSHTWDTAHLDRCLGNHPL